MDLWNLVEWLDKHYSAVRIQDSSMNGLQVEGRSRVERIATIVDASHEAIKKAISEGADLIIAHHGIFWGGHTERVTRTARDKVRMLLENNVSLYAMHLPMDEHPETGNNIVLARKLGLREISFLRDLCIAEVGVVGRLEKEASVEELESLVEKATGHPVLETVTNREKIRTVAVITGGASSDVALLSPWIEALVTGEFSHSGRILARESGITVVAGGHYATETLGPRAIAEKIRNEHGIEAFFVEVPTGD